MVQVLYESAARPFEFLALWKSDVAFEQDTASIHIRKGKGGFPRDITLPQNAGPLLRDWIFNEHPLRKEPDFPLWVGMLSTSPNSPFTQVGLRGFLTRLATSVNLKKRLTPYTFRHTRLTDLARLGGSEFLLSQLAGWRPGSKMPAVYIHLSHRDQKPALQKLLGLTPIQAQKMEGPKTCENCRQVNVSDAKICSLCKLPMDAKAAFEVIKQKDSQLTRMDALEAQNKAILAGLADLTKRIPAGQIHGGPEAIADIVNVTTKYPTIESEFIDIKTSDLERLKARRKYPDEPMADVVERMHQEIDAYEASQRQKLK